ncbi:MAG: hypothetical protein Q7R96_02575 [Nanoarchaeota archaeon]|nr:hypothetical protein [Nanoarchaeota archaeon]
MTKTIPQIKTKLNQAKSRLGLVGGSLKLVEYDDAKNNVSAHINPQGWNIEITVKSGFNPITDKRQKAYARKKKIEDGLETLLTDILHHECGHWQLPYGSEKGCPFNSYHHDKVLEAIEQNLPADKKGMASYVANAFEDCMVNSRAREFKGDNGSDFSGQVLFWDNEGLATRKEGEKGFTPFYDAFVRINMHLWGDKVDEALVSRHYGKDKKVEKAVNRVINKMELQPITQVGTAPLFQKERWPEMAGIFAKELAELLETPPTERLSAYGDEGEGQGSDGQERQSPGNGIEKKAGTKEGKEEIAYGRYAGNDKQSPHMTDFEQLDSLYQRLARDIPLKVESMTREHSIPIAPVSFRPFDEDKDDLAKIRGNRVYVDEDEGVRLGYAKHTINAPTKSKTQKKSFPDFKMIMLDNSSSMKEGVSGRSVGNKSFIPWGDESKYHYALLGLYGIEGFLKSQGIAQYIGHGISLFSSNTRYTEGSFSEVDRIRKQALHPDWGSTNLDATVLNKALTGRESVVLSISDGEIGNWDTEKENIRKALEGNQYAHIQIGGETTFTQDLKSWGFPVFHVTNGRDLTQLMVDVTRNGYKRYTTQ